MKVRVRKSPDDYYIVEKKSWHDIRWMYCASFHFSDETIMKGSQTIAEEKALKYAKDLVNPLIIEVKP